MPFVDLSNPNSNNTSTPASIQSAQDATPSAQNISGLSQSQPVINNQNMQTQVVEPVEVVQSEQMKEEHSLLQTSPVQVNQPNSRSEVREIKGPPLPGDTQESIDTMNKLTFDINQSDVPAPSISNQMGGFNQSAPSNQSFDPMKIPSMTSAQDMTQSKPMEDSTLQAINTLQPIVEESINQPVINNIENKNITTPTNTTMPGSQGLPSLESILGKVPDPIPSLQNEKPKVVNSARILTNFNASTSSMDEFLAYTIANKASDLHVAAESPAYLRVDGALRQIPGEAMNNDRVQSLIFELMDDHLKDILKTNKEVDFSVQHSSGDRFRANVFHKQGTLSIALRLIPNKIKTISELHVPEILYDFTKVPHGLIVVTGPTGSGKSTTIAAMLQEINMNRAEHIITIEDPIEYVYPRMRSLIEQREIGKDSLSWSNALRSALRQDPNIVLVGEMRDYETIEAAVTVAETGHLVFATLHTNSAAQTVDRIIDVFPEGQQSQIRAQLSNVLTAVVAQRLIPVRSGGRKAVLEIMIGNSAVKNAIREGKTYQIDNIIQTNSEIGMQTLESSLVRLIKEGEITADQAANYTVKPDELYALLKGTN